MSREDRIHTESAERKRVLQRLLDASVGIMEFVDAEEGEEFRRFGSVVSETLRWMEAKNKGAK